jgi:hypothetical protein
VNGRQGALQTGGGAKFLEGEVWFARQKSFHLALVVAQDHWFASGKAMARGDIAGASSLLQKFLDHPFGNSMPAGDFRSRAFVVVVGAKNPLPQVQG